MPFCSASLAKNSQASISRQSGATSNLSQHEVESSYNTARSMAHLQTILQMKAQFTFETEDGLLEVVRTLQDDSPILTSRFGNAFRSFTEQPKPFTHFEYKIEAILPQEVVSLQFTLHPHQQLSLFASLQDTQVTLIDVTTKTSTEQVLEIDVSGGYTQLDARTLFGEHQSTLSGFVDFSSDCSRSSTST